MLSKITAKFEIVTPMFLGGADHEATRIRESSLKGALAFWWRALNYAKFVHAAGGDQTKALKQMQRAEQKLFGGGDAGQGAFLLRVSEQPTERLKKGDRLGVAGNHCNTAPPKQKRHKAQREWEAWEKKIAGPGARYFGYGLMGAAAKKAALLDRSCIKAGQSFTVRIVFRDADDDLIASSLVPAVKLFGLLGGLGSRIRRGYGSVTMTELTGDVECNWNADARFNDRLLGILNTQLMKMHGSSWPDGQQFRLTAFAKQTQIWVSDKSGAQNSSYAIWSSGLHALDQLGRALLNYRAWGQNGKVGDQAVQAQFEEDHNWFYNKAPKVNLPHRTAFGLPQNYFKFVHGGGNLNGSVNQGKEGRRGSPMFFHIHKQGEDYIGVVCLFPTFFIPDIIQAKDSTYETTYDTTYGLDDRNGSKNTTGYEVLKDFVGHGPGHHTPNKVMSFKQVYP